MITLDVPAIIKLPFIVTLVPSTLNAVLRDEVYEFILEIEISTEADLLSKLETLDESDAVVLSKLFNLPFCVLSDV